MRNCLIEVRDEVPLQAAMETLSVAARIRCAFGPALTADAGPLVGQRSVPPLEAMEVRHAHEESVRNEDEQQRRRGRRCRGAAPALISRDKPQILKSLQLEPVLTGF